MSEFELGILRQRAQEAYRQKVLRGEVLTTVPIGFVRRHSNGIEMTPDREVQEAIRRVFSDFERFGTLRQVLVWYHQENITIPLASRSAGAQKTVAHARRGFYEALDHAPKEASWVLIQIGHLYDIERSLRRRRTSLALRDADRASQSVPICNRIHLLSQKYGIYGSNKEGMNPQDLCRLHNEPKISQTVRFGCTSGPFSRSYEFGLYNYNVC